MTDTKHDGVPGRPTKSRNSIARSVAVVGLMAAVIAVVVYDSGRREAAAKTLVAERSAGTVTASQVGKSTTMTNAGDVPVIADYNFTLVATTLDRYRVKGAMLVMVGDQLDLRKMADGRLLLCHDKTCGEVLDAASSEFNALGLRKSDLSR